MDKPVLLIEAPELDDKEAASAYCFLQELLLGFESHYYPQLRRAFQKSPHFTTFKKNK
jgi:hypothetical protein